MVYFNCEACNETLKKSQVENHSYRCHAPFSCVDCGQTFQGHAYQKVRCYLSPMPSPRARSDSLFMAFSMR
jgi:methionyl-tRNA synthetase